MTMFSSNDGNLFVCFFFFFFFFFSFFFFRLILVTPSTATNLRPYTQTNPKFGQRIGLDGNVVSTVIYLSLSSVEYVSPLNDNTSHLEFKAP